MREGLRYAVGAGAMVLACASSIAMAQGVVQLPDCGAGPATVYVSGMGMATAEQLKAHMTEMQADLDRARRTEAPSGAHLKGLEQHMRDMEAGMAQLEAAMAKQNCPSATVSLSTRVENLEARVEALQRMLEQIVGPKR